MDRMDAVRLDLLRKIEHRGWALQGVFPTRPDDGAAFCYTVGLCTLGHPELAMYGLPPQTAGSLLNTLGDRIKDDGARFEPGQVIEDLLAGGLRTAIIAMSETDDLSAVRAIYGEVGPALQVVWPDAQDRLPWEPGYDYDQDVQPLRGPAPVV